MANSQERYLGLGLCPQRSMSAFRSSSSPLTLGINYEQILTGRVPYQQYGDHQFMLRIAQGTPPALLASMNEMDVPQYAQQIFEKCWRLQLEPRPPVQWCSQVLQKKTTFLFDEFRDKNRSRNWIPSEYVTELGMKDWFAIHNPAANTRYRVNVHTWPDIDIDWR